ncbi:MAG: hypothetical protein M1834_007228 [Cirrosporium novae-zelandiae]|nr:MAG: hypothetical protein M1834_007228 [Cirrosporium novae-zelandiae]
MSSFDNLFSMIPAHPLGIKPSGNAYMDIHHKQHHRSLGTFELLPHEILIQVLEFLNHSALSALGQTCKVLLAFTRQDDLWKTLFIRDRTAPLEWLGTWRATYLGLSSSHIARITCDNLFSDTLYRPFFCTHVPLDPFARTIPSHNQILRLEDLSEDEFSKSWTKTPFILTNPVRSWKLFKTWSTEELVKRYGNIQFRAEAVDWPLLVYVEYMERNSDESPLYLFDRGFVEKMNIKVGEPDGDYTIPDCFKADYFSALGKERPDHRWLIMGPERSGSTFHKDPNATSAWNAVIRGSKYWIMFPSSALCPPPPGVFVSEDQSEVTSPLSIAEWLVNFHAEARRVEGCIEGICYEGEILHVPSGWWHLVVNLSPAIAITQNFVPRAHLPAVLKFLKDNTADQVSGFKAEIEDPYALFVRRMEERYPEVLDEAIKCLGNNGSRKKRKWEELCKVDNEVPGTNRGFSFGFGADEDAEIP